MTLARRQAHLSPSLRALGLLPGLVVGALAAAAPAPAPAQVPEPLRRPQESRQVRPLSDDEIVRRLRMTGLSPEQIRRELELRGVDRTAADPYLEVLQGRTLRVRDGTDPVPLLRLITELETRRDTLPAPWEELGISWEPLPEEPPVFGREIFRRATTQFDPVLTGPVPVDYRVGPGDELVLVLTGGVELAYELTVSREGWIVVPDVGRIVVNGRTLGELREVLFQRLSQVYSGIRRDESATTFFDITVGRLRTNQVFVIGEVERPSAYAVSGLATALSALYPAGGPTRSGSFREVLVNRGGETVARIDLYEYLTEGRAPSDVRLEHGDIVFVPVARNRVEVSGAVVRPGIYEVREGEGLRTLLRHAGGIQPHAELRRVQVERVLPPEERMRGMDRAILDVPVGSLETGVGEPVPVRDGDRVTVFALLEDAPNEVRVSGGVWRPGRFATGPGTRLSDVIERAGGLLPDVVEGRAQIQRLRSDWTRELIPVSLATDDQGRPVDDPELQGRDEVFIFAARELREDRAVSIGGWVREPGVYPYVEGMTVADLVLRAGGLRTGAYLGAADVSRMVLQQDRTHELTRQFRVALDSALVFEGSGPSNPRSIEATEAGRFALENLDAVYVRRAPGFDPQATVTVTGEVLFPGPYSVGSRIERLSDLIERAGGLTSEAYAEGFQLWRLREEQVESVADTALPQELLLLGFVSRPDTVTTVRTRVGVDFHSALRDPGSRDNVLLEANDSIFVPRYIPTVEVRGAVASPTKVLYEPGRGLGYYIEQAGGYLQEADEARTRVEYASGRVAIRGRRILGMGGRVSRPDPGSVVTVPREPPRDPVSTRELVAIMSTAASALATLVIAVTR